MVYRKPTKMDTTLIIKDDEIEVVVHWTNSLDDFEVFDKESKCEIELSESQEIEIHDQIREFLIDDEAGYGDYMYERRRDR